VLQALDVHLGLGEVVAETFLELGVRRGFLHFGESGENPRFGIEQVAELFD
jgi:hypothetical protein